MGVITHDDAVRTKSEAVEGMRIYFLLTYADCSGCSNQQE